MAVSLPRLLRRVRPDLAHFQHALPLGFGGPSVVTVHDLSFEAPGSAMGLLDRLTFRAVVPRAVRGADHVRVAVSERTKRDIVERYGVSESKVTVTPNGVDPAFSPGAGDGGYVLFVGAIQARKHPEAALEAARAVGLPLVVAGPEKDASIARELRDGGADLRGYVSKGSWLPWPARCAPVLPSVRGFRPPAVLGRWRAARLSSPRPFSPCAR
jgi:glycosyltransferase involved in cell wall biosynthesis